jgi:hypothetical protein
LAAAFDHSLTAQMLYRFGMELLWLNFSITQKIGMNSVNITDYQ